ncbi:hypothetical protein H2204_003776 [Knufia peltigerae]|uniref:Xylanolytic transcriptional activator regulatory domain-containing protein n=1 Tax=Knufia peltigerae TaxID=1002370 RepID=A0AA38Y8E1_9EURO|nr:hypothetical protein H2204_003776 [Knufia peltigerae]
MPTVIAPRATDRASSVANGLPQQTPLQPLPESNAARVSASSAPVETQALGVSPMSAFSGPPRTNNQDKTLGLAGKRFAELYGLTSDMEPILMPQRHRPYDPISHEFKLDTHSIRRVQDTDQGRNYPITFHVVADDKVQVSTTTNTEADSIEDCVQPHGARLVQLFWRMVQPSYPVLFKAGFMEKYQRSYRRISPALLGAVYLISLTWWSYDTELSIQAPPDSRLLRQLTSQAIQNSYHLPRLSSIEAILLFLQCKPENPLNPDHTFVWGYVSQALAVGECIGIHLDCSGWSIPQWEKNLRKRLAWALFLQDKWTSMAFGRPSHIHGSNWGLEALTLADFDGLTPNPEVESNEYELAGKAQFLEMIHLSQYLSEIQVRFYTLNSSASQDCDELFCSIMPLVQQLQQWYIDLPASVSLTVRYQRQLSPHGYLHLAYHGVMMNLVRRLVRSAALPPRTQNNEVLSEIRKVGFEVAQAAMKLVTSLRPDHLEAFWFSASSYIFSLLGSFITLLLVTSVSSQERDHWQDLLNSYIWTLRTMNRSSEPMRYAANRLEGAILRGLEHALAIRPDESADFGLREAEKQEFDFSNFANWDLAALDFNSFDLLEGMDLRPP